MERNPLRRDGVEGGAGDVHAREDESEAAERAASEVRKSPQHLAALHELEAFEGVCAKRREGPDQTGKQEERDPGRQRCPLRKRPQRADEKTPDHVGGQRAPGESRRDEAVDQDRDDVPQEGTDRASGRNQKKRAHKSGDSFGRRPGVDREAEIQRERQRRTASAASQVRAAGMF